MAVYIGRPPPRYPSGKVVTAGFEYGRSRVQYPVKDRVIPKTLYKCSLFSTQHLNGNTGSFSRIKIGQNKL